MPGTHRAAELAGPATPLAPWANIPAEQTESGVAVGANLEGAAQMFGKAGCCAVNYTTIWHRRVPNFGANRRRIIWSVYKRESERFGDSHKNSASIDLPGVSSLCGD